MSNKGPLVSTTLSAIKKSNGNVCNNRNLYPKSSLPLSYSYHNEYMKLSKLLGLGSLKWTGVGGKSELTKTWKAY